MIPGHILSGSAATDPDPDMLVLWDQFVPKANWSLGIGKTKCDSIDFYGKLKLKSSMSSLEIMCIGVHTLKPCLREGLSYPRGPARPSTNERSRFTLLGVHHLQERPCRLNVKCFGLKAWDPQLTKLTLGSRFPWMHFKAPQRSAVCAHSFLSLLSIQTGQNNFEALSCRILLPLGITSQYYVTH